MADGAVPPRPTGPSERIDAIDVLRGLALLGVVAINVVTIFRVSIFQQFLFPKPPLSLSSIDSAIETILTLAVELKALALFSLLFGAGLAIQFERLANSERRTSLLVRRLVVLLAFGLIHLCLIWNGDILTEYALAGFIVLPFLFGPRWLLAFAALAFLGLYLKMQIFPPPGLWPGTAAMSQDVVEAHRIYATGSFLDVLAFRLREIPLSLPCTPISFRARSGCFFLARSPGAPAFCETRHAICSSRSPLPVSSLARHRSFPMPAALSRAALSRAAGSPLWRILSAPYCWHWVMAPASSASPISSAERACLAGQRRWDAWHSPTTSRNPSSLAGSFTATVSACSAASALPAR
jgi:hypothetical protein